MIKPGQYINHNDKLYKAKRTMSRTEFDSRFNDKQQHQSSLKSLQQYFNCDWTLQTQSQYVFCDIIHECELDNDGN